MRVAGKQAVTIPPLSEKVIEGHCRIPPRVACKVLVEISSSTSLPRGLLVANVLAQATEGKVPVRILNASDKAITLFPRCRVAELSKPRAIVPREVVSVEEVNGEVYVRKVSCGEVSRGG